MASGGDLEAQLYRRIVYQRVRNRIAESFEWLSEGEAGVRHMGADEYINQFFDNVDDGFSPGWKDNTALSASEVSAIQAAHDVMVAMCAATPQQIQDADLIDSGWLVRIVAASEAALEVMNERGRFDEEAVEPGVHR